MVRILLILLIVPFVSFGQANRMGGFGYRSTTGYYRSITIDHTKVPSNQDSVTIVWRSPVGTVNTVGTAVTLATGDNFPTWMTDSIMINGVVYKVSSITTGTALVLSSSAGTQTGVDYNGTPYLRHQNFGGKVTDLQGDDIIYATDALGTSLCKWDKETYDSSTGVTVMHILFQSLSSSVDDVRYIRYGGTQTTFQGGATGSAYASTFKMIQHMQQPKSAASQTVLDASAYANNMTTQGSSWSTAQTATGKIGLATSLVYSNSQYYDFSDVVLTGDFTISAWCKLSVLDYTSLLFGSLIYDYDINWYDAKFRLWHATTYGGTATDILASSTSTVVDTWTHFIMTRTGSTLTFYQNGTSVGSTSFTAEMRWPQLGRDATFFTSQNIVYDELQVLTAGVTANWTTTVYNSQNDPFTFYTNGAQI